MSFLYPATLFLGLLAAGVVALYLQRPKRRSLEVSSLLFWQRVLEREPQRQFLGRLRHPLSPLLQLLIFLLLLLAPARPEARPQENKARSWWWTDGPRMQAGRHLPRRHPRGGGHRLAGRSQSRGRGTGRRWGSPHLVLLHYGRAGTPGEAEDRLGFGRGRRHGGHACSGAQPPRQPPRHQKAGGGHRTAPSRAWMNPSKSWSARRGTMRLSSRWRKAGALQSASRRRFCEAGKFFQTGPESGTGAFPRWAAL